MTQQRPLWAPWRIDFIRSKKNDSCFLCEKAHFESQIAMQENHVIAYGKHSYILMNDYPYSSGHLMIASKRHCGDLAQLSPEERSEMMELCVKAQAILTEVMCPDGFNIGFNIGTAAGAGVAEHLHMHVVPRWNGDSNFMAVIANNRVIPEALNETTKILIKAYTKLFGNKNEN